jgi:RimJ/RimL family protein N-acetyltransferase
MTRTPRPREFLADDTVTLAPFQRDEFIECMDRWVNDPAVTAMMFTGTFPRTRDQIGGEYDTLLRDSGTAIFRLAPQDDIRAVGFAGLFSINWVVRSAEFRILIGMPEVWNGGLGTAATRLLVRYAFLRLNLNKVWLGVNAGNLAAQRCYEKAGFVREGVLRSEMYCDGAYHDVVRMSVLRGEFSS